MPLKIFFKWFDDTLTGESDSDEKDRSLECSLVRCMSAIRERDLQKYKLSDDFQKKFLEELSRVEQEPATLSTKINFAIQRPSVRVLLASASLILVIGSVLTLRNPQSGLSKIDRFDQSLETAMVEEEDMVELDVLTDFKRGEEDIDLLKNLENFYKSHGYLEKADRVHFKLETISR